MGETTLNIGFMAPRLLPTASGGAPQYSVQVFSHEMPKIAGRMVSHGNKSRLGMGQSLSETIFFGMNWAHFATCLMFTRVPRAGASQENEYKQPPPFPRVMHFAAPPGLLGCMELAGYPPFRK